MTFLSNMSRGGRRMAAVAGFGILMVLSGFIGPEHSPEFIYVCLQGEAKVAVIDVKKKEVDHIIDLTKMGFSANAKPHYAAVEKDGSHWYLTLIADGVILKLDRKDRIVARFKTKVPGLISLHPNKNQLVVGRSMSAVNPPQQVVVLDRDKMEGDEIGVLFPRPHPMVVSKKGIAYTGSLGVNQLAAVVLDEERVEITSIEGKPRSFIQFALSPDERTMVATGDVSGSLMVFDPKDPEKPALVKEVELSERMVFHPVFTSDGKFVWVPMKHTNEIVIIETKGWTTVGRIKDPSFKQPHQIVFSADGKTAFVSNNAKQMKMGGSEMSDHAGHKKKDDQGSLTIIDVEKRKVVKAIKLGKNLTGMGARARW